MLNRIKINLINRPVKTLLIFFLFLVLTSFIFFSLSTYRSANSYAKETLLELGGELCISANTSLDVIEDYSEEFFANELSLSLDSDDVAETISTEQINEITDVDGVLGVDVTKSAFLTPINFNNSKVYEGEDPYSGTYWGSSEDREKMSNAVSAIGCIDVSAHDYFVQGYNILVEGEFPTDENPGAVISMEIAEENNLSIGDEIEFCNVYAVDDTTYKTTIVGIYSYELSFYIEKESSFGETIFSISPYNIIFTDYTTCCNIVNTSDEIDMLYIKLESPFEADSVMEDILKSSSINFDDYDIFNSTEFYYGTTLSSIENLVDLIYLIVLIASIGGFFLFIIIFSSLNDDKELGILLSIGEEKNRILKQKCIENLIISIITLPIAVILGLLIVNWAVVPLTPSSDLFEVVNSFTRGAEDISATLKAEFNIIDILLSAGFSGVLWLLSCAITWVKIRRYKIYDFLYNTDEEEEF